MYENSKKSIEEMLNIVQRVTKAAVNADQPLAKILEPYMSLVYQNKSLNSADFRDAIREAVKEELYKRDPKAYLVKMREVKEMLDDQMKRWDD